METTTAAPARSWRAFAYQPNPGGRPIRGGRTSATTPEGLLRFITEKVAAGWQVQVWQVLLLPGEPDPPNV